MSVHTPVRIFAVATAFTGLFSPCTFADTLHEVYQRAQAQDAGLKSAQYQLEANQEKIPQARAGLLPSLAVQGQIQKQSNDIRSVVQTTGVGSTITGSSTPYTVALVLTQPLFRVANWETFEQSKLAVAQSQLQYLGAQQDLMLKVAQAYFDVLAAQDALGTLETQKAAIAEQLAAAKRNFDVGNATVTDQQEAQARFDLAQAQTLFAQNDLTSKKAVLQTLVGAPLPDLAPLQTGVELTPPQPLAMQAWTDSARAQNLQVQAATVGGEIARRDIQKARAGHYPTLDLTGQLAQSKQFSAFLGSGVETEVKSSSIGLSLAVPLYTGGAVNAQVREKEKLLSKANEDLEQARRAAVQNTVQAFGGVQSGLAQVKALEAAQRSSRLALESNKLGYQVGVRINIDVLNAQQQVASTERDLSKAKYDTLLNSLRLKAFAGTLKEDDLSELSRFLQPSPAVAK